jgi:transcriptional regulator with XRE-family HTH domain
MAPQKLLPRQILARNLKALLNKTGLSASEVAKKAGVDRKTINNQLNARYDPRPEQVDAVASVFGLIIGTCSRRISTRIASPMSDCAR